MATPAPEATIVRRGYNTIHIKCPYCKAEHEHFLYGKTRDRRIRRAPGCGNVRSNEQRITGYWITLN